MTLRMKPVDVVLVGFGWTGAIMAQQLADAGLGVLALERTAVRNPPVDFATTFDPDELRYVQRQHLFQNTAHSTLTFRNNVDQQALPIRRLGAFLPGTGVGGAGVHWNGVIWRFLPTDFKSRSHNEARYGRAALEGLTVQDYPVTYEELEPYYTMFDRVCGTTGKAGNLRGTIQPGGNPFEGPRSEEYPNPPMTQPYGPTIFAQTTRTMGLSPFPQPGGNMSRPYTNPFGAQLGACTFCGYCEQFGCGNYSKSSPQATLIPYVLSKANFELRSGCDVLRVERTPDGLTATGVTYIDGSGQEYFQPASIVVLTAFQFHNVHLLLTSGIGKPYDPTTGEGVVGKNFCYQTTSSVQMFFDDKRINPFIGAGALGMVVDDYNGDNFDHAGLGFIGGGGINAQISNGRPITNTPVPEGTPSWGLGWKRAVAKNYNHTFALAGQCASHAQRGNYLSLDPTYRDQYGRPMLRMTFDFPPNDVRMSSWVTDRMAGIAREMNPTSITVNKRAATFSIVPYQSTHITGGTITGATPVDSVVNRYGQSWDVHNLFVTGAGLFPQNAGYNPTGTLAALAYHSAAAIRDSYLKAPAALVQA